MNIRIDALRIRNDGATLEEMRARLANLLDTATGIQARADEASRALTAEEQDQIETALEEFETLDAEIRRRTRLERAQARSGDGTGRRTTHEPSAPSARSPRITGGNPAGVSPGQWGFRAFGDFAVAVHQGARQGGPVDPRLIANAPTTYGTEQIGPDGGFAVPPDFRREIVELVEDAEQLLGRTDMLESSSNTLVIPADSTAPWDTTNGIQAFWESEGGQLTQSKPSLEQRAVRLHKLTALVGVTEELLEDAPALDAYLRRKAPEKINFKVSRALVAGTGVGQPLGVLNSPGTVVVAAEAGPQTADTVVFANLSKMWSRCWGSARTRAIWLINQDVEPQLTAMEFPGDSAPVFLPGGNIASAPFSTLWGRPVIPHEVCNTLGDKGDIILGDWSRYMTVRRTGGIRADVSMHLWFDFDMSAFRFVFRVGGQPWWNSAITPRSGSTNTLSPFVTLAERA